MNQVRIVRAEELVENVPTPGMERRGAVAGPVQIISVRTRPGLVSGWHHHADYTTCGYVVAGRLRLESGPAGTSVVEGGPGETVAVARADELKVGQMKLLHVGGRRVVLARTEKGHVAFDDRCTHRGGPLADGVLICGTVACPWHGSQFDVHTGEVKAGPAEQPITTYTVKQAGGEVRLHLPAARE